MDDIALVHYALVLCLPALLLLCGAVVLCHFALLLLYFEVVLRLLVLSLLCIEIFLNFFLEFRRHLIQLVYLVERGVPLVKGFLKLLYFIAVFVALTANFLGPIKKSLCCLELVLELADLLLLLLGLHDKLGGLSLL
jgi:hypothetical protein